jgi:putative flippase GtrA
MQGSETFTSHLRTFLKANATAIAATVVDFSTLFVLVEFVRVYYVFATACGAFLGAVTNFSLNRIWAFRDGVHPMLHVQGLRYAIVSAASMALNTLLVYSITEYLHVQYLGSKAFAALLVGWFWNYPMHRYFVFPRLKGTPS